MGIKRFKEISDDSKLDHYISRMIEIHDNKYEYPNIEKEFKNTQSKITIRCKKCGEIFTQTMSHHIWSKSGCRNCYGNKPNTIDKIIEKSKKVHGDGRYSYPSIDIEKISAFDKITIHCNRCNNTFMQSVAAHLNKSNGCPRCSKSKTEQLIENYLISNNVKYITQYKFDKCIYKRPLPFDFYLPEYNLCIEFDGEQHFSPRRDGNIDRFDGIQVRDEIKNNFCVKNNINIERISYVENLSKRLKEIMSLYNIKEIVDINSVSISFSIKKSKICSVCKIEKDLSNFNKSTRMIDGYKSSCRECASKAGKNYYKKNNK